MGISSCLGNWPTGGHYPAIDVLQSVSRVLRDVSSAEHLALREKAVDIVAVYGDAEDMISIGAYVDGSDPRIDYAKKMMPEITRFLRQPVGEKSPHLLGLNKLKAIFAEKVGVDEIK